MQEKSNKKQGRPARDEGWTGAVEDMPLNSTEKLFVFHYCDTGDISEAARKTGSDAKDLAKAGSKILHRPNVKKAVKLHQDEFIKNSAVTKSSLIVMLMKNWQIAIDKEDIRAANECVKLLGQTCPDFFYTPVKNLDLNSESKPKAGSMVDMGNVIDAKDLATFSITNQDEDIEMDLERHLDMDKSRELGIKEFEDFDSDGNVIPTKD